MQDPPPPLQPSSPLSEAIYRWVPAIGSLRNYSLNYFAADCLAGLTVAAVAVPQAMAYALIAGIPPQHGLYTAIVMTAVGAVFDSSKQLINGPTNAISIAVFSALALFAEGDKVQAAILLALMVGTIQTAITFLRLGDLSRYVSHAVIVGFTLGAALLLFLDQLKNILGLPPRGAGEDHFLRRLWLTLSQVDSIHQQTVFVGVGTIFAALVLKHISQWLGFRLPEFLLALIGMGLVVWRLDLETQGVKVIGEIPPYLPSFQVPVIDWLHVRELAGSSLAIAVLGLLEAIAMAKAIAAQTRQKLDINQQCLSEGLANVAGSFFQCFPGSGSLTRSNINKQAGAVTQWSGVISAIAVACTVVLFAPYARYIPKASLAGILLVSAWRLVDRRQLGYYLRTTRFDAIIVLTTAIAAVAVSVEFCILIGVFLSFVLYVPKAGRVHLTELILTPEQVIRERVPEDPVCERMRLYNLEGELFFGAAPELEAHCEAIEEQAGALVRVVVLRVKRARNPDAVCLEIFDHFIQRMHARGVAVLLCGVRAEFAAVLRNSGLEARLGADCVFQETGTVWSATLQAVRHAYALLDGKYCAGCPRQHDSQGETGELSYMI